MASGILKVAHPKSSIPKSGRDLPLGGLSAVSYAFVRSSTRMAMSRSTERLLLDGKDSPPPQTGRINNGIPLGAGDLPDYSMFQERAPGALVIGEELFTSLGYHSERRCQVPMQTSWAVTPGLLAGIVLRGHGVAALRLLDKESRSSPSSSARLQRRHYLKATSRGVGNSTSRSLKAGHPKPRTESAAG